MIEETQVRPFDWRPQEVNKNVGSIEAIHRCASPTGKSYCIALGLRLTGNKLKDAFNEECLYNSIWQNAELVRLGRDDLIKTWDQLEAERNG